MVHFVHQFWDNTTSCAAATWCPLPASGDLNNHPEQPGDLGLWPIDLGNHVECQPWQDQPSYQIWPFCNFLLSSYGQTCIRLTLLPWPTFEVIARVGDVGHCIPSVYWVWSLWAFSFQRYGMACFLSRSPAAWWPWPLTFQPLNFFTGHPVTHGFLRANVQLLGPSILDLGSGTGQTDWQQPSVLNAPTYSGRGVKMKLTVVDPSICTVLLWPQLEWALCCEYVHYYCCNC